ncbi:MULTISPECIES: flagellar basal body protein [unclassified Legionella]|uniref:flagellar basal body protein n=1 Tax=unclassified Legionella TaxID=2622702 RepID=UPI0010547B67|nr:MULTISPECIES: flagellar basal body protein [unclassified Legionella]MDI9817559.1 flagellar basal body protein [Legionella sp. PL877]
MSYDTTIELISLALDASLMRQTAVANNIANANTPDYQPIEVNFEQQLTIANPLATNRQATEVSGNIKPFYQQREATSIDEQVALSVQNATHYRALIKGLNQKFAIMKLALQGNNQS